MPYDILQSSTQAPLVFLMVDSGDHITGKTGLTPSVTISKAGGSFASCSGATSEIASGWYKIAGNATDTGTLGPLVLHATATSCDPTDIVVANIVAYNPQNANLSMSNVSANVVQWNGTNVASPATAGIPEVNVKNINNVATSAVTTVKAVQGLTTADTITTYTGNTPQTADVASRTPSSLTANGNMKCSLVEILTTALTETAGQLAGGFKKFFNIASPAATMDHGILVDTVTTTTTATNLTNAPTAGDLTAAMQTTITNLMDAVIIDANLDVVYSTLQSGVALTAGERNSTADAILARSMGTEGYAAKGGTPTVAQALFMLLQHMQERSISGTTYTIKKLDGSTTAMTLTLDNGTTPTSITRAT